MALRNAVFPATSGKITAPNVSTARARLPATGEPGIRGSRSIQNQRPTGCELGGIRKETQCGAAGWHGSRGESGGDVRLTRVRSWPLNRPGRLRESSADWPIPGSNLAGSNESAGRVDLSVQVTSIINRLFLVTCDRGNTGNLLAGRNLRLTDFTEPNKSRL